MNKDDVIQQYKDVGESFKSFYEQFDEIDKNGIKNVKFCLDEDGIWKRLPIKWCFEFFLKEEKYHHVAKIKDWMDGDGYIADVDKQEELNKKLKEYYKEVK